MDKQYRTGRQSNFDGLFLWSRNQVRRISIRWFIFILVGIGILAFGNILPNGFVWDDFPYIVNNSDVYKISLVNIFLRNTFNNGSFYRPFALLYFQLLYSIFHDVAAWYHAVQIGIHIINTILLYILFTKFFKPYLSFVLAAVFLIHPIQVESVAFVAGALGPLSFLFGILALLYTTKEKTVWTYIISPILLIASILVKETGVLFMPIILFFDIMFNRRKHETLNYLLSFLLVVCLYGYLRIYVGHVGLVISRAGVVPIAGLDFVHRLINAPLIILYYVRIFLFPVYLAIDQQWVITTMNVKGVILPLGIVSVLVGLMLFYARHLFRTNRQLFSVYIFFLVWFGITLLFHLQLFPLDMTVADRFFYMPIVGLLGIIGVFLYQLQPTIQKSRFLPMLVSLVGVLVIVALFIRTVYRNSNWLDERTLYTHDIAIYDSFNIENNLGSVYIALEDYRNALDHFKRSYALLPTEMNSFNIGYAHDLLGELSSAASYYVQSLTYNKYPAEDHRRISYLAVEQLSTLYLLHKQYRNASEFLSAQLPIYPTSSLLWKYFAISEYNLHKLTSALEAINQAKKYLPANDTTSDELRTYMTQGKPIEIFPSQITL